MDGQETTPSTFAWPNRPKVGESVQLCAGSQRFKIVRFEGDVAVVRTEAGEFYEFNYRALRPWLVH